MGCAASKPEQVLPSGGKKNDSLLSIPPPDSGTTTATPSLSSASGVGPTKATLTQGHHWAEGSPGKERRAAKSAWDATPSTVAAGSIPEGAECAPCEGSAASAAAATPNFEFKCTFPMMVMKMETFMKLEIMTSYEELIKDGLVFEWTADMGRVFFLSHQWTSFSHPDPESEQLKVAQEFLGKVKEGRIKELFATEEEWLAFHHKEVNRFLQYEVVTEQQMADDVSDGYVWLDFASVPQAVAAEEERLRAIDSIPYYVDHALCFLAIVPKIQHKDLPGTYCTYKSWMDRGWCRLETQVHELRLFVEKAEQMMPGIPKIDLPRRPLIVHSGKYATTYDMMDNFYMLWQRKSSVFTGEFACCRLGHKRKDKQGEVITVTCDKTRIRPLVKSLWERKVAHLARLPPFYRWMFHWRWTSHSDMMMSDFVEDCDDATDTRLETLEDLIEKYMIHEDHRQTFIALWANFRPMFEGHPSFLEPDDTEVSGGGGPAFKEQMSEWFTKWEKCAEDLKAYQIAWATSYATAEGNLKMLKKLHTEHGADLTMGYCWGITLLDFCAGKGHTRIIEYLLSQGVMSKDYIDKPSFRERITAIDRACKAGFVEVLDLLHDKGAILATKRLNRQQPSHGAAIMGHTHVLQRLSELGLDLEHSYDEDGKSPLDYATYFCHKDASDYLRGLQEGRLTRWEEKRLLKMAVKMQALRRGESGRRLTMQMKATQAMGKQKRELTDEEKAAVGAHM